VPGIDEGLVRHIFSKAGLDRFGAHRSQVRCQTSFRDWCHRIVAFGFEKLGTFVREKARVEKQLHAEKARAVLNNLEDLYRDGVITKEIFEVRAAPFQEELRK